MDTKVLIFSLMRSFIITLFDLAIVNKKQWSCLFWFFFWKKKKIHPKKIIKLDPKQQTLFGLLGQQIRPTWTTKSETADDGDLDNENPQSQTEPTKHQTKMSLFVSRSSQNRQNVCPYSCITGIWSSVTKTGDLWKHFHKPVGENIITLHF